MIPNEIKHESEVDIFIDRNMGDDIYFKVGGLMMCLTPQEATTVAMALLNAAVEMRELQKPKEEYYGQANARADAAKAFGIKEED